MAVSLTPGHGNTQAYKVRGIRVASELEEGYGSGEGVATMQSISVASEMSGKVGYEVAAGIYPLLSVGARIEERKNIEGKRSSQRLKKQNLRERGELYVVSAG